MSARILVVDDEEIVLQSCRRALGDGERVVDTASSGAEALKRIEEGRYDVVLLDIMMPDIDGLQVLQRVKESHPDIEVIMVTGLSQIETAVRSIKLGAFDYLPKPFDPDELSLVVDRAFERRRLLQENVALKSEVGSK
ncbi:MAG TPA: response regulator, partial [Burkholderiales bacterium]|nr:response regulator [Burkholderiales bacterium]